jgi:hypothetical protein
VPPRSRVLLHRQLPRAVALVGLHDAGEAPPRPRPACAVGGGGWNSVLCAVCCVYQAANCDVFCPKLRKYALVGRKRWRAAVAVTPPTAGPEDKVGAAQQVEDKVGAVPPSSSAAMEAADAAAQVDTNMGCVSRAFQPGHHASQPSTHQQHLQTRRQQKGGAAHKRAQRCADTLASWRPILWRGDQESSTWAISPTTLRYFESNAEAYARKRQIRTSTSDAAEANSLVEEKVE